MVSLFGAADDIRARRFSPWRYRRIRSHLFLFFFFLFFLLIA